MLRGKRKRERERERETERVGRGRGRGDGLRDCRVLSILFTIAGESRRTEGGEQRGRWNPLLAQDVPIAW
jgi:hypothetical protein